MKGAHRGDAPQMGIYIPVGPAKITRSPFGRCFLWNEFNSPYPCLRRDDKGFIYIFYIRFTFQIFNDKIQLESIGIWVRGCGGPVYPVPNCTYQKSDMVPVVLYRYLSLTVISRGAVRYTTGVSPKATESMIY